MTCSKLKGLSLIVLFLAGFASLTAACSNTVDGAGQDIENAGEEIQESVE